MFYEHFLFSFLGIFVAMDMIGVLPIYLNFIRGLDAKKKVHMINQSIAVAFVLAILFLILGKYIFKFFGIAVYDFKIGGGIVLLVMSILDLVQSKTQEAHTGSTGIVPLAVPLITGPALITTLMLQVALYGYTIVVLSLIANFLVSWVILRKSNWITKLIGKEGTDIVSKIAALFMTAIACSLIRGGILEALKN